MATLGVDYSYARPGAPGIAAAGYRFAVRYLSGIAGKDLTRAEAAALHAADLSILLVFETTASRASEGAAAGAIDAAAAQRMADALGYPAACPIFYAVDFDADPSQVQPYFTAVRKAAKHPVGIYGGIKVMTVTGTDYRWQACAWSGVVVSPHAHLYQRLHPTVAHPVKGTDEDILLQHVPMWDPPPTKPAPRPKPEKQPARSYVRHSGRGIRAAAWKAFKAEEAKGHSAIARRWHRLWHRLATIGSKEKKS